MSRETKSTKKVALLATGDEISQGDILNTNSQEIAQGLFRHGIKTGMHLVSADSVADIETAIGFLLQEHDALIITGGLGPTSDDLTRYALSHAVAKPLVFNEDVWQAIVKRLKYFGYDTPPISNRQQALFPEGATIIPNPNGTAAGCMIEHYQQLIFMLPGPPTECLPLFAQVVLPTLQQSDFPQVRYRKNWFLFGVSEGQIAEELDNLAKPYDCTTGYRLFYPYIEFKLHSNHHDDFQTLVVQIEQAIKPYLLGDGQQTASELLRHQLTTLDRTLTVCDHATGGMIESLLKTPKTYPHLHFTTDKTNQPNLVIQGMEEYWQGTEATQTRLTLQFQDKDHDDSIETTIPFRGARVKAYAVELICWEMIKFFFKPKNAS